MLEPGQRVNRIENQQQTGATVLAIDASGNVLIAYDEGGTGWWPQECLESAGLVRARDELGRFIADDPSTPDVDEAWVEVQL